MIALASDHGGFSLKETVREYLVAKGLEFKDYGVYDDGAADYPLVVRKPCEDISSGRADRGIFFCGTGIGVCIAANKYKGIRAACVSEVYSARLAREHNDANVLCLGGRILSEDHALKILDIFLETEFSKECRHTRRIKEISEAES